MLENRNQLEIEQKLKREMEREGLDALILTEPETILYASGFASHFLYDSRRIGTTLAVVRKEGPVILILNEIEKWIRSQFSFFNPSLIFTLNSVSCPPRRKHKIVLI